METTARRYNSGKPRMGIVPLAALADMRELTEYMVIDGKLDTAVKHFSYFAMYEGDRVDLAIAARHIIKMLQDLMPPDKYATGPFGYPSNAITSLAMVYTRGAEKYTDIAEDGTVLYDGTFNWAKGMSWVSVADSGMRHLVKSYSEVNDPESGLPHLAHALWNIVTLFLYTKEHPEYDDRRSLILPRVGLDIDGVIADFTRAIVEMAKVMGEELPSDALDPHAWNHPFYRRMFQHTIDNPEFWAGMEPLLDPANLRFEPVAYITSRPVDTQVVVEWLERHRFPVAPVTNTWGTGDEYKIQACKDAGVKLFIDDRFDTFQALNAAGIPCLLMDRPHNAKYDVGCRRIFPNFLLTADNHAQLRRRAR
jgi:hypothetical protein